MTASRSQKISPFEKDPRKVATAINKVIEGRTDNYGSVTLGTSTVTTVVTLADSQISENSVIAISPRTANAAAAMATTYVSAVAIGSFTLTHANAGTSDRTFDYAWIG